MLGFSWSSGAGVPGTGSTCCRTVAITAPMSMPDALACLSAGAPDRGPAEARLDPECVREEPAKASIAAARATTDVAVTTATKRKRDTRFQSCRMSISLPAGPERRNGRLLLYPRARAEAGDRSTAAARDPTQLRVSHTS